MHLLLFDIDGTLLNADGAGREAIGRTLDALVGSRAALTNFAFGGKLDWAIWRTLLASEGFSAEEVDVQMPSIGRRYVAELAYLLAELDGPQIRPLPGVPELLRRLAGHADVQMAIVTGNMEAGAWLKLDRAGLQQYFTFGAFGDEALQRAALPVMAVQRATTLFEHRFEPAKITVIGDTVDDIASAKPIGARAVGVATGSHAADTLRQHGADVVCSNFADLDATLAAIGL